MNATHLQDNLMLPRQRGDDSDKPDLQEGQRRVHHGGEPKNTALTRRALSEMSFEFARMPLPPRIALDRNSKLSTITASQSVSTVRQGDPDNLLNPRTKPYPLLG